MKPHLLKVYLQPESSFNINKNRGANFYDQWHFHPEIELIYIHKGRGTRFIGNDISRFGPDELFLIGSNLPHMWRCDPDHFLGDQRHVAEVTVIYFHRDFLGTTFFDVPEMNSIKLLLEKAKLGVKVSDRRAFNTLITQLYSTRATERVITLLAILDKISVTDEKQFINVTEYPLNHDQFDADRLNKIFNYSLANFRDDITLIQIASIANLTSKAFCKYFKSKTRKTYSQFLLEVRVAHACKLLLEKDMTIYEVCLASGFNSISNFNRYFKKIMSNSPTAYRKERLDLLNQQGQG